MDAVIDEETREQMRKTVGTNIARLRETQGLNQTELAEKAGISRIHVSRIENGHHEPSACVLFAVADALHVPADALRQISVAAS